MTATEAESSGEQAKGDAQAAADKAQAAADKAQPANFDALEENSSATSPVDVNLEVVLNVSVDLALEVGRTTISVRDLLQLNQGSIIELDRLAGEPLDLLINGTLVARGEVVVVNEKYGIRLTDVISPTERIKQIQ